MARILGLDIGARSLKALILESSFRGYQVSSFAEHKLDEGPQGLAGALATLKQQGKLAADQVVVALPGSTATSLLLTLPFADAKRIEATIGFEVEGQLPYDLTEVVFDYQVLAMRDGKSEVLVSSARKPEVTALLATLAEAGIDPRVVTTSSLAYHALLATSLTGNPGPAPQDGVEAILDLGHERTSMAIGGPQGLEYARTFAGGGKDLTRAIAGEFKVTPVDAETWKENEGDVTLAPGTPAEVERAAAALLRGLAPTLREVRSTIRAHFARFKKKVTRIYISGGTAKLKGLDAVLSRELGVEVLKLDPIPRDSADPAVPRGAELQAAQSFALAVRGHGTARAAKINLRRGEFAFKGDLDYLKGKVSRLVAYAAVLLVLTGALIWAQFHVLSRQEGKLDQALCTTTQKILGQCQKDYLVALSLLKGKSSPAASLPQLSALDLFAELTARSQKVSVKLNETEVQLDRVRVRGETDGFEGVDKLVAQLQGFRCFPEIKRGKVQKNKDGSKVQFDLDIRVQCPDQAGAKEEGA